jgi:hypothetical protein
VFGYHVTGSTGTLFRYGIVVGAIAVLGLSLLQGPGAVMGGWVEQISSAKAVCGSCEVDKNCLSYALETMPHGIWGGTTREERIAMRVPSALQVQVQVQVHGPGEAPGRGVWPLSL